MKENIGKNLGTQHQIEVCHNISNDVFDLVMNGVLDDMKIAEYIGELYKDELTDMESVALYSKEAMYTKRSILN
jgi:hypothetical protein